MVIEKFCLYCTHFEISFGSQGYSIETPDPGSPGLYSCYKKHFEGNDLSPVDFYKNIQKAKTCKDYVFDRKIP